MSDAIEKPLLELEKVSKRFRLESGREIQVLEDINLTVNKDEIIAFLGPSGCGKTTTLKMMAGLTLPSEGKVLVNGSPLKGINSHLSMVFQTPSLLPWYTVSQNVGLGLIQKKYSARKLRRRVEESVDMVELGGFEDAYPRELSGGLRQRVGMARALAVRPEILCLDEPFNSLDALTAEDLRQEVVNLWMEQATAVKTIVLVTHDIFDAVYMAQRIYVFGADPGHIRTVVTNTLPYPREEKHPKFLEYMDRIHAVITEALIPEEAEADKDVFASQYQGLEHIPPVGPSELVGLLELLDGYDGTIDIFEIANETDSEFGHCLAVVKMAELLDFVDTPKQKVVLTKLGREYIDADDPERREIFTKRILDLRVFEKLMAWIEEAEDKEIPREEVINRLQSYFPNERLDRLFDTLVAFGRFVEILAYNAKLDVLGLPREEEPPVDDEVDEHPLESTDEE